MKIFRGFKFSIIILLVISAVIYLNFLWVSSKGKNLVSPLPDFLTYFKNKEVSTITLWLPKIISKNENFEVSAKSALVYDLSTDKIIYSKNPNERLPMASLTKIMTAIVALENKKNNNTYVVSKDDLVGEDVMGLTKNEILSLNDLLYGLFLHSANDAAETLATNYIGGRKEFIKAMNQKAKSLGLKDTNFTNPTGLEGDGTQYTTAHDLLIISRYALSKFPEFLSISSTFDYLIPETTTHKAYFLENETNLLTSYPGVRGIKTGYTPEAGLCLVTYLKYSGHEVIGVLLGSNNRREEMKELLDMALKTEGITPPPHT